jgi:hypothetical protein
MQYMLAALLAVGIGIVAAVPAALAEGNAAHTCYGNGVASACVPNTPSPPQQNSGQ